MNSSKSLQESKPFETIPPKEWGYTAKDDIE